MEKAYTMPRSSWRHDGHTRLGAMKNILIVVAVGLVGLAAAGDRKIQMKDLPQPVQKAVQQEQAKGVQIVGLASEVEGGKTMYEVETTVNGHTRDLLFDAAGALVETEEETPLSAVPAAVKTALEARGKVLKVETLTKGSTVTYEAQVERNGKKSEVEVDANGKKPKK
jgi:uncharacterized membrane protein YkoI